MGSYDDEKVVPSSKDFGTISPQHNVQLLASKKYRYGLQSLSLSFRQLWMMGTVFVVIMGLLSRSYFETPFKVQIMDQSFDRSFDRTGHLESLPEYNIVNIVNIDTSAASNRSLKIFEEKSIKASSSSSPKERASSESAQEGGLSIELEGRDSQTRVHEDTELRPHLPADNSVGNEKHVNDGLLVPYVESAQGHPEETGESDDQQSKDRLSNVSMEQIQTQQQEEETKQGDQSTADLAKIEVSPQEPQILLEKDGSPRTTPKDKKKVKSKKGHHKSPEQTIPQPADFSASKFNSNSSTGKCDVTVGKWVHDPAGPLYRSDQCSILSQAQNCQRNGRPDQGYEFFKWEPEHCSLPRFEPIAFLELMHGKTLAFVGDSLARNQMESLMCILLRVAEARPKGSKDIHKWYFPAHKFTVIRIWSSWLVQTKGDFPPSLTPSGANKLNLTELDDFADHLHSFDVTILSSGHWWVRKTAYFMHGELAGARGWRWPSSLGEMKINHTRAFEIAMNTALQKVGSHPGYTGLTILRTFTPDHYSGGSWDTGGSCTGETKPYNAGPRNSFNEMMRDKQLKAFRETTRETEGGIMPNGSKLRLLDVYPILNYRGDGHPGPYRNTDPEKKTIRDSKGRPPPQDCLHWCMPGPVDTMNELLFDMLRKEVQ